MLFVVVVVAVPHWWDFLRWGIGSCIVPFIFVTLCSSNRKRKNKLKIVRKFKIFHLSMVSYSTFIISKYDNQIIRVREPLYTTSQTLHYI